MFPAVDKNKSFPQRELVVGAFWKEHGIYEKTLAAREGAPPVIRYVTIPLITPLDGPPLAPASPDLSVASLVAPAAASAAVTKPVTCTREEWGADESLRFSGGWRDE